MQIIIRDHGPLKEKVTITLDGEVITFSSDSFVKLETLMTALGATLKDSPGRAESKWILHDAREYRLLRDANEELASELEEQRFAFQQMSEKLLGELDALHKPWWRQLLAAIRTRGY